MKRGIIFGSVPVADWSFLQKWLVDDCLIICADGGRLSAEGLGLQPDWYVGDSDSGGYDKNCPADILPSEKDVTDLEMAVSRGIVEGCDELLLCGCTGGRQDHHLAAIGQLERIYHAGKRGILLDERNEIYLLAPGVHVLPSHDGFRYFGLVPLDAQLTGVSINGAKYEVKKAVFQRWSSLGISNETISGKDCAIQIESGIGLLIFSN